MLQAHRTIPVSHTILLLFLKVMYDGHSSYLQTEETTTLITANFMCGRFASAGKSSKYFFLKMRTLILQKLMTENICTACLRHLTNTWFEMTQLRRILYKPGEQVDNSHHLELRLFGFPLARVYFQFTGANRWLLAPARGYFWYNSCIKILVLFASNTGWSGQ